MANTCNCASLFFFFNDTATTEIYTLSLHDALPIFVWFDRDNLAVHERFERHGRQGVLDGCANRSEEHTSELQSQSNLVCRLLLEKKKRSSCRPRHRRYSWPVSHSRPPNPPPPTAQS